MAAELAQKEETSVTVPGHSRPTEWDPRALVRLAPEDLTEIFATFRRATDVYAPQGGFPGLRIIRKESAKAESGKE